MKLPDLPICEALPGLIDALKAQGCAVLQAPPGAGKTTVVPLAILNAKLTKQRIIMLEPRRLAARSSAERMADTLGEKVGQTVGYRIRGESKVTPATRIEVVTEGILTRMIQNDPSLDGIGVVIFDEFHERSLNADLGLALVWESRGALRDDLMVVVMSATLDAEPVAKMLDAPVITSAGRAFDVSTHWLDKPPAKSRRFEDTITSMVMDAVAKTSGGVLVFLPGEGEIRRVQARLGGQLPKDCALHPLFGAMDFKLQRAAIAPPTDGKRKIVLATSIAETSLTIASIEVVIDGGLARRARFDPGSGMSRLVTETVSKAEADQRRGRAGRVRPGVCFRAWTKGQEGGMAAFPPAEIQTADLSSLVLDLARWGARGTENMAFLTAPNPGAYAGAHALLHSLGALDERGAITAHGQRLAALPLHPRLAHMLTYGGPDAALLAALLSDRDPVRGASVDLMQRQGVLKNGDENANRATVQRIRHEAKRLNRHNSNGTYGWPVLAALAYPDRIGLRRSGTAPRWILSGGKEAVMDATDPMASARMIVATELDGDRRAAKIRMAVEVSESDIRELYGDQIHWVDTCEWSIRERRVLARQQEKFRGLTLQDRIWNGAPEDAVNLAALDGIRDLGLTMSGAALRFTTRVELLRAAGHDLPDMSMAGLMAHLEQWLLPHLKGVRTATDIKNLNLSEPLNAALSWDQTQVLNRLAPAQFTTPMGRKTPIDYTTGTPEVELRLQEMFGQTTHPVIAGKPLRITLLSPARRPLQTTTDLPGFWASSYSDVRKDMRGRYPKHPWPEDPTKVEPTLRAKPRKR